MTRITGISVCVLFCALIIRERNKTVSALLTVGGIICLLGETAGEIARIVKHVENITESIDGTGGYIRLMLKVLAITLLTQTVSDICRDNGENALAGVTEFSSKVIVVSLILPLFETVISIVGGIVK